MKPEDEITVRIYHSTKHGRYSRIPPVYKDAVVVAETPLAFLILFKKEKMEAFIPKKYITDASTISIPTSFKLKLKPSNL